MRSTTVSKEAESQKNHLIQDLSNSITNLFINYNVELHSADETSLPRLIDYWEPALYSLVTSLCTIFQFGLKEKKLKKLSSFLKKKTVSTDSFSSMKKEEHFWPFVTEISSKSTLEIVESLGSENAYFQSEDGKEIGWIIQILNEGFVLQNFEVIKSNSALVKNYYEDYALLLDDSKLVSIEFLVSDLPRFKFNLNPHQYSPQNQSEHLPRTSSSISITSRKSSFDKIFQKEKIEFFPEAIEAGTNTFYNFKFRK